MKRNKIRTKRPATLQFVLIFPFVLQIFGSVGLVGYLSFKNGQKAVDTLAKQLIERTSDVVNQHLDSYLSIPHKVSDINADVIRMGLLDVRDRKTVGKYFWHQLQTYDLSYACFYLVTGDGAGAGRYDGKTVTIDYIDTKTPSLPKNFTTYATDNDGNLTQPLATATWDTLNEPFYTEPVKAGKPMWIPSFTTFYDPAYPPYIAAAAVRPIYDAQKKLIGVVGAEIHLLQLSAFLRNLDISRSGQVFIMERNGLLVANSGQEKPFTVSNNEIKRLTATDSPNPVVQSIAQQLEQDIPNLETMTDSQKLQITFQGEPYYVHIEPWRDEYGLDWLVVTSVPERTFMEQIDTNTKITLWLCCGALVVATAIGIFTSRWIARPILRLNQASQAMASGNLQQTVQEGRIAELNTLASSFNQMAEQLRKSFAALEKSKEELEERVEERTVELQTTLGELKRTQAHMVQSEKMSSLGQLVAGVAHEINNPVNFIHGNLSHASEYIHNLLDFVRLYQQANPHPTPEIEARAEEIELEFLQEDLPKTLSSMQIGTQRIREIVLSLRTFSRMDESEIKTVDIHEGLESTLLILQHRFKAKDKYPAIALIKEYARVPLIKCYASALNQVFMNIISNAVDALRAEPNKNSNANSQPTIIIRTFLNDDRDLAISIADNGQGMDPLVKNRIFDPFFTTKPVGTGTGLGLSISYQIVVEKHQGQLICNSTPGKGTEIVIVLSTSRR